MKVKITSDSTCDLSPELVSRYDIGILPLLITFGEKTYRDGVDTTPADIYRFVEETGSLPKTCALNTAFVSAASFLPPVRMPVLPLQIWKTYLSWIPKIFPPGKGCLYCGLPNFSSRGGVQRRSMKPALRLRLMWKPVLSWTIWNTW